VLVREGKIAGCGDYSELRTAHPHVPVRDLRGGYLLPGLVDTHVHFPQIRVLGGLGRQLLDWLECVALPEEARMADLDYAGDTARRFVRALAAHGTTTALVFGSHFKPATAALFDAAERSGIRVVSGMVLSDRLLRPELHQSTADAYRDCSQLIREYHGRGRLLFAVTPRFALSTSEEMLEVCQTLMREHGGLRFQTHINENPLEIEEVARLFPWAKDYLAVYERFDLSCPGAVMAHNVHASDSEIERLAAAGTSVSHCPFSNALLGSGLFSLRRHIEAGVGCALGTDVGGGAGFGILKEALQAYSLQRLAADGILLTPGHLLYLSTLAGAEALQLEQETGDFTVGKSADYVYLRAPPLSILEGVLNRADTPDRILAALFTLAGAESVVEVRVGGVPVRYED
jgi:guanine deaminase